MILLFTQDTTAEREMEWDGISNWNTGPSNQSASVAILLNQNLKYKIQNINSDNLGRRISIDIEIENETFQILNIYGPNKPQYKENFLNETNQYIKNLKNVILVGDFDIVEELRDKGGNINNSHLISLKAINKLKNYHNLEDTSSVSIFCPRCSSNKNNTKTTKKSTRILETRHLYY